MAAAWAWMGRKVARTCSFPDGADVSDLGTGLQAARRMMSGRRKFFFIS
jgi:hypothetical protein